MSLVTLGSKSATLKPKTKQYQLPNKYLQDCTAAQVRGDQKCSVHFNSNGAENKNWSVPMISSRDANSSWLSIQKAVEHIDNGVWVKPTQPDELQDGSQCYPVVLLFTFRQSQVWLVGLAKTRSLPIHCYLPTHWANEWLFELEFGNIQQTFQFATPLKCLHRLTCHKSQFYIHTFPPQLWMSTFTHYMLTCATCLLFLLSLL